MTLPGKAFDRGAVPHQDFDLRVAIRHRVETGRSLRRGEEALDGSSMSGLPAPCTSWKMCWPLTSAKLAFGIVDGSLA
jgi:hypothetical protein